MKRTFTISVLVILLLLSGSVGRVSAAESYFETLFGTEGFFGKVFEASEGQFESDEIQSDDLTPAATRTWVGAVSGNLVGNGNWTPVQAQAGDDLIFPQTALNKTMNNNFAANTIFNSLTFNGNNYVLNGNQIGLSGNFTSDLTGVSGGNDPIINAPIQFTASSALTTTNRSITFTNTISTAASSVLEVSGAGTTTFNGNFDNTLSTINKVGSGRMIINGNASSKSMELFGGVAEIKNQFGTVQLKGGALEGDGTVSQINGSLSNSSGTIRPGDTNFRFVTLTSTNAISLRSTVTLEIEINGSFSGRLVSTSGNISLNNANLICSVSGSAPNVGSNITIVSAGGGLSGQFSNGNTCITSNGHTFSITYNSNTVVLTYLGLADGDSGDAPASYGTLSANNGARHRSGINDAMRLGATKDFEFDGQPNANASGDGSDEDGVTIGAMTPGTSSSITINAFRSGAGNVADINCWVDFNRDGDFDGNSERIVNFSILTGSGGTFNPNFNVPANASIGTTFLRCRIGTNVALPTGLDSLGGEVEDYQVTIGSAVRKSPADFDGDGKTDLSIFRPVGTGGAGASEWWYQRSSNNVDNAFQFGTSTDVPVPGDYTGDGKTDIAFWRPSNGQWFVLRSEDFSFYSFPFGTTGDIPAPADYDGDGKTDPGIFRPSNGTWFLQSSLLNITEIIQFGANGDRPVPADYEGDGKADIAVYRPGVSSQWWLRLSTNSLTFVFNFGTTGDRTVPGDYTGDGKADIAVFRPSNGNWFVFRSEDWFSFYSFPFGTTGDVPVPGDYDGDGKTDAAVFRPSNTTWFMQGSTSGTLIQQFGASSDVPVPSAFVRF